MTAAKCPRTVWTGWAVRACDRPVKRDGLCGIHAAADERVRKNDQARRERIEAAQAQAGRVRSALAELGVDGIPSGPLSAVVPLRELQRAIAQTRTDALRSAAHMVYDPYRNTQDTRGMSYEDAAAWEATEEAANRLLRAAGIAGDIRQEFERTARESVQPGKSSSAVSGAAS